MHYAKAGPDDILMTIEVSNAGPDEATLHVLPTAWFRNTWSWDGEHAGLRRRARRGQARVGRHRPRPGHAGAPVVGEHGAAGRPRPGRGRPVPVLCCENETNPSGCTECAGETPYPKDGINDHVIGGGATVNPDGRGTKCAFWYRLTLSAGAPRSCGCGCVRPAGGGARAGRRGGAAAPDDPLGAEYGAVLGAAPGRGGRVLRRADPVPASADEALVMRQAFAGLLWCKQLYYYDVARWLDGDPAQQAPPPERRSGRNSRWRGFDAFDLMSMPDKWEYPVVRRLGPVLSLRRARAPRPAVRQVPADLAVPGVVPAPRAARCPPTSGTSATSTRRCRPGRRWRCSPSTAAATCDFLSRVFDKLLVNFTWWVNREDAEGNNLFEGGFLGLDNIGPIDRSHLPVGGILEQADATGWMAFYAMAMTRSPRSCTGPRTGRATTWCSSSSSTSPRSSRRWTTAGLWDEADGLYYDRMITPSGDQVPVKVRSFVAVLPALAMSVVGQETIDLALTVRKRFASLLAGRTLSAPGQLAAARLLRGPPRAPIGCCSAWPGRTGCGGCSSVLFDEV